MAASGLNIIEVDDDDIERLVKEEAAAREKRRDVDFDDSPRPNPSRPNSPQRTSFIPGAGNGALIEEKSDLVKQEMQDVEQATGSHGGAAIEEKSDLMERVVMDFLLTTGGTPGSSSIKDSVTAVAQKIFTIKKKTQVTILPFKGTSLSTIPPIAKTSTVTTSPTATTPRVTSPIGTPKAMAPTVGAVQLTRPFIQTPQVTMLPSMLTSHSTIPPLQVCKLTRPIAKTSQVIATPTAAAAPPPQVPTLMRTPQMTVRRTGKLAPIIIVTQQVMTPPGQCTTPVQLTTPYIWTPLVVTPTTIGVQHIVQGTNPIVRAPQVMTPSVATPQLTIPVIAKPQVKKTIEATIRVTSTPVREYRLRKPVARKSPETEMTKIRPSMNQTEGLHCKLVEVTATSEDLTQAVVLKESKPTVPSSDPLKAPVSNADNGTALTDQPQGLVLDAGKVTTPPSPPRQAVEATVTPVTNPSHVTPSVTENPPHEPGNVVKLTPPLTPMLKKPPHGPNQVKSPPVPSAPQVMETTLLNKAKGPLTKVNTPSIAAFVTMNLPQVRVKVDKVTTVMKQIPVEAGEVTRLAGPQKTGKMTAIVTVNPRQPAARPFHCPHCVKNFTTELRLRGHLRDHQDVNSDSGQNKVRSLSENPVEIHQCPHCVKKYSSELKLHAHMRIHKGTLKIHQCTFCPARYAQSSDLRIHVRKHTKERPYRCSECDLDFSRMTYLNKHLKEHTKDKTFNCSLCSKSFPTTMGLKNHEKEHPELCCHRCPECGKPYKTQFAMKYHLLTHSKVKLPKCPVCYRLFSEDSNLATHMLVHVGEKKLTCPVCDTKFTKAYQKRIHMRIHVVKKHGERGLESDSVSYENSQPSPRRKQEKFRKHTWPHKCLSCGKSFPTEGKLDWHTLIHSAEKPFQCSICNKAFSRKCSLKEHAKTHTGEKPFSFGCDESLLGLRQRSSHMKVHSGRPRSSHCTDCGSWFLSQRGVETHRRTAETPLSCMRCNSEFSSSCDLRVHRKSHIVESRNRRWDCSVCGVTCKNKSHLRKHQVKHSSEKPYRCPVCDKGFARNSDMRKHKFIHSSEKPYCCSVCRKGFNCSSNLRLHERRHKEEKPHRCSYCSESFYVKQGLTRHTDKHHPDKDPMGSHVEKHTHL